MLPLLAYRRSWSRKSQRSKMSLRSWLKSSISYQQLTPRCPSETRVLSWRFRTQSKCWRLCANNCKTRSSSENSSQPLDLMQKRRIRTKQPGSKPKTDESSCLLQISRAWNLRSCATPVTAKLKFLRSSKIWSTRSSKWRVKRPKLRSWRTRYPRCLLRGGLTSPASHQVKKKCAKWN